MIRFPGRQTPIAFTLATGIGVDGLQKRIDEMEYKAITGKEFTEDDKRFLRNFYSCIAKGGESSVVLRQSGRMMQRYLSRSGEALRTEPRIFVKSRPVQRRMALIKTRVARDFHGPAEMAGSYSSDTFYMGAPKFFDSFAGLYFGRIKARPTRAADGGLVIRWRAECPWQWPSYESLFRKYGRHHAQRFPLPNAKSIFLGSEHCLRIDDGLGGHLETLRLAKPFLVYSEWTEDVGK